jgi:hypothetical protein
MKTAVKCENIWGLFCVNNPENKALGDRLEEIIF